MRRLTAASLALSFVLSAGTKPVWAADPDKDTPIDKAGKDAQKAGEKTKGPAGTNIEMPFLMAPMNNADGKLAGYAYISTILIATSPANALVIRDKLAFIQDIFVRDVNGTSVAKADDPTTVDNAGLQARLQADAKKVMGPGQVASLSVVLVQIAPLHPKRTEIPASQIAVDAPLPEAPAPAAPAKTK